MKNKKVLIIDDEVDFGFLMTAFFQKKGGRVSVATSITDGLRILENENPDYIFLDNNLPDGLGWSKAEFIVANYPNAQLILISAMEVPKTSTSAFRILYKPLLPEELHQMFS